MLNTTLKENKKGCKKPFLPTRKRDTKGHKTRLTEIQTKNNSMSSEARIAVANISDEDLLRLSMERKAVGTIGTSPLTPKTGLQKQDSNDDGDQQLLVVENPFQGMFPGIGILEVTKEEAAMGDALIDTNPPKSQDLKESTGVLYHGVPFLDTDGNDIWTPLESFNKHFDRVMSGRLVFNVPEVAANPGGTKKRGRELDQDISCHDFRREPAEFFTELMECDETRELVKSSKTLELLVKKWPLNSNVLTTHRVFDTPEWKARKNDYCMVATCIRSNPLPNKTQKKKWKIQSQSCICGAILAGIAKGVHDQGTNPHLTFAALLPYLGKLDAFRTMILTKDGSVATKELLCFYFRIFVMTNIDGNNQSKFAIIGTDQRNSALHESKGVQLGILPLCLETQRFLFGQWENWAGLLDGSFDQNLPPTNAYETKFSRFISGCLKYDPKKDKVMSSGGKVLLSVWYNGKKNDDGSKSKSMSMNLGPTGGLGTGIFLSIFLPERLSSITKKGDYLSPAMLCLKCHL
jgi:hypothetical protein